MKVLLINGSPHPNGCTRRALNEVAGVLKGEGIATEIVDIGTGAVRGCTACGHCKQGLGKCIFDDDVVNRLLEKAIDIDGLVIGSPVYYSSANGALIAVLDRMFYSGKIFSHKVGAAVVSARRAGTTATLDQLNKYFSISQMPIVSSQYWNMIHGNTPEEAEKDLEGLQTMRVLGRNMAWLMKSIQAGKERGISVPAIEPRERTNFIR